MPALEETVNPERMISAEAVVTHFQPIVSIKKKSIIGFEALSRGVDPASKELVPPQPLFRAASLSNSVIDLDRLCRKKALENFRPLSVSGGDYILTINMDPSILNEGTAGSDHLYEMTQALAMQPGRILVEIPESMIGDVDSLVKFVSAYRAKGFLLALDDIGSGLSNLDRISLIKPDILKLDRSLIRSTTFEYHSREIVRSMVNLSHRIGSLVIAGGIETVEEALLSVELGVDMLQGFYFAEPGVREAQDIPDVTEKVNRIADDFRKNTIQKINARKMQHRKYNHIINDFTCELTKADEESFDTILENLIRANHELECAYILDDRGIQVSSTVFAPDKGGPGQGFFFQPGHHGTDQSSKDYFFLLNAGLPKFTTQPYISLASRNVCITISVAFRDINYKKRILCLDITQDDMSGLRNAAP